MVLHDLNHAARYADHVIAMRDGAIVATGPPDQVVTRGAGRSRLRLDCLVVACPVSGRPLVVPKGRHAPRP
jgi:iron complex transport system ATP-binding protein